LPPGVRYGLTQTAAAHSLGVDSFHYKWRLQVVLIPLGLFLIASTLYLLERRSNAVTAAANFTSNAFFVVFFCYPRICT